MTASNLGVIASVRGDDAEARRYFESGLADARLAGLADQTIATLVNLGLLHMHQRRYDDADRRFAEARELAEMIGEMGMLITVELEIAKLRLHQQRHADARACAQRAREVATRTGTTHADGEAAHVDGLVACAHGELAAAESHFLRAEEIALQRSDLILQGETARELAALYRSQGRNRQTLQRLNQAHRLFSQLRARRELADVDRRTTMLESDFLEVVRRWGESIESKDIYTQGHCVRVADLACALWARASDGDATSRFWFRIGALLHDVGKLLVPAEVLNKPGKLTRRGMGARPAASRRRRRAARRHRVPVGRLPDRPEPSRALGRRRLPGRSRRRGDPAHRSRRLHRRRVRRAHVAAQLQGTLHAREGDGGHAPRPRPRVRSGAVRSVRGDDGGGELDVRRHG